jgi:hypothetical protein
MPSYTSVFSWGDPVQRYIYYIGKSLVLSPALLLLTWTVVAVVDKILKFPRLKLLLSLSPLLLLFSLLLLPLPFLSSLLLLQLPLQQLQLLLLFTALGDNGSFPRDLGRTTQLLVRMMASGSISIMSAVVKTKMTHLKS